MERRLFIETFGLLTKIEQVKSIDLHNHPNALVLEITQPYPGYYSAHELDTDAPRTLFLITREAYSIEHIVRLGYEARKAVNHPIDVTPCRISIFADSYYGIRVKYLENFGMLKTLQEFFKGEGISFLKHRPIDEAASIEIQKLFNVEEVVEGVYQDLDEPGERYVAIPSRLDFGQFLKVSKAVKNNLEYAGFDAAQAVFYRKRGVVDAVRIFDPSIHLDGLLRIRDAYEVQIRRLMLQEL
jgi:hypothetical protein